jgi:hypothetical protein
MIRTRLLALDHQAAMVAHRAARRIGYRGVFLAGLATLDLFWAWGLWDRRAAGLLAAAPASSAIVGFGARFSATNPLLVWAILFALVGALCGWQAWVDDDRAAFTAAWSLKVLLAILTLAAWPDAHVLIVRAAGQWICLCMLVVAAQRGIPYRQD